MALTKLEKLTNFISLIVGTAQSRGIKIGAPDVKYLAQHLLVCQSIGYNDAKVVEELDRMLRVHAEATK